GAVCAWSLNADAPKLSEGPHPSEHLPISLSGCRKAPGPENAVEFIDNGRHMKIFMRVDAANNGRWCNLLTNFHTGSPGSTVDRWLTGTGCLDRTVTRQDVRPFLGHTHR